MALILDTCGFLSLTGLVKRPLSPNCRTAIAECGSLYISACSLFEIALKHKRHQLDLADFRNPVTLWKEALSHYRIEARPVDASTFNHSVCLPDHHSDPFDRIIIAESLLLQVDIITYDEAFDAYGVRTIS